MQHSFPTNFSDLRLSIGVSWIQPSKEPILKKKLAKRIDMLKSLSTKFESKYGPSDPLVRDIAEEIQTLRAKEAENNSALLRGRR